MKVYFTAAITQREQLEGEYQSIINAIQKLNHQVVTAYDVLNQPLEEVLSSDMKMQRRYFSQWQKIIQSADASIVEVSFPSTIHIGTEIGAFIERGKPLICLYVRGRDPAFLGEFHSSKLIKLEYNIQNIDDVLRWGFEEIDRMINRRFTFFVSPDIDDHLTKVSQRRNLSRSEYIRELILKDMKRK